MVEAVKKAREYNEAKLWQIAFFALNNTATNLYMFAIGFVSYYATGIAGLSVVVISTILTAMRVFDSVTDPIIGFIIDKTESKFGKFRPIMVVGNIILATTILIMYNVTHHLPDSMQFFFFIFIYAIYIIGYTMQTACTRGAQTVLTNHPKQRPIFSIFDATYNTGIFVGGQIFVASYLVEKHGGFDNLALFQELNLYAVILSGIFTILAVIAIASKDRKEFFGLADQNMKVKFKDYWPILKNNRPMQMLVVAASTDKLAMTLTRQPAVVVMVFGIMFADYSMSGTVSLITVAPILLFTFYGVNKARKIGLKRAFVFGTWLSLASFAVLAVFLLMIDTTTISLTSIGINTIIFLILYSIGMGFSSLTGNIVIPMIADVSDYETYKTGRYVPGMMGTIFSFVDKMVSSLAPAIVGFLLAMIGFRNEFPQIDDPLTTPLLFMTILMMFGIPIIAWILSLIAMKFYQLDDKKMEEVQDKIALVKEKVFEGEMVESAPRKLEKDK
ncbi:MFS transporter [Saliterribacillus persicus]|uniref:Na+/melibiose symporter-like transporter n=1 Tax=Saliterribacillus persicus TaxID=930114 RepID=A0A368Y3K4_9BACI|nr:MFS transporter [Saliterribacillus persicus]RCW74880.1 Na+/melibiose symporter-like transporter [Saliterribacillus persicus]